MTRPVLQLSFASRSAYPVAPRLRISLSARLLLVAVMFVGLSSVVACAPEDPALTDGAVVARDSDMQVSASMADDAATDDADAMSDDAMSDGADAMSDDAMADDDAAMSDEADSTSDKDAMGSDKAMSGDASEGDMDKAMMDGQDEAMAAMKEQAMGHLMTDADLDDSDSAAMARSWMDFLYLRVQEDKLSPPVASRAFAYAGIAMYEAVAAGSDELVSLQGQLNDMPELPEPGLDYDATWGMLGAVTTVATGLFSSEPSLEAIQALFDAQMDAIGPVDPASLDYGTALGEVLLSWAAEDGAADALTMSYTAPEGPGLWVPTAPKFAPALLPYWKDVRTFAMPSGDACTPPPPAEFSEDPDSQFMREVNEVYDVSLSLTEEQQQIAEFWADNPGDTGTPPGHWVLIAGQVLDQTGSDRETAVETYALVGMALADSFISCWDEKYRSNLIRPITVIQNGMDPDWQTHVPTPPFPEYTSGHSTASGSAAAVMTALLGEVEFVDTSHVARGLPPREFESFTDAADEAAISRLYGGIHYRMAIEEGLDQGRCVARHVVTRIKTRS